MYVTLHELRTDRREEVVQTAGAAGLVVVEVAVVERTLSRQPGVRRMVP